MTCASLNPKHEITNNFQLVDLMRGEINLTSELGQGTTTTFWIPFNKPQSTERGSPFTDARPVPESFRSEMTAYKCHSATQSVNGDLQQNSITRSHLNSRTSTGFGSMSPKEGSNESPIQEVVDRKDVHVLIVEDKYVVVQFRMCSLVFLYRIARLLTCLLCSAVNQQIALKTVKKFGFSVNAVWNGKEALDYLLETPSTTYPKPDIILMDCQMPVLDGYRATHLIRHHKPYSAIASIRTLPIVAMTASAIQGDREKCTQAGMVCTFGGKFRCSPFLGTAFWLQDSCCERQAYPSPPPHP